MKNIRFNMLLGICFFLLFALLGACGGGDSPITDEIDDGKAGWTGPKNSTSGYQSCGRENGESE